LKLGVVLSPNFIVKRGNQSLPPHLGGGGWSVFFQNAEVGGGLPTNPESANLPPLPSLHSRISP